MRKIINILLLLFNLLFVSGCAITDEYNIQKHGDSIEIDSNPQGAIVEINNEYMGETPCLVKVYRPYNYYTGYAPLLIVASPTEAGHCVQARQIESNQRTPKKMFFNMAICREKQSLDVNINQ